MTEHKTLMIEGYLHMFGGENQNISALIASGAIPELKDFTVQPGKVSDSIYGGKGSYETKDGIVEFENPPFNDKNGNPIRILTRTGTISTHDVVRGNVPFKDQVLALNHNFMRKLVEPWMPHAQIDVGLLDTSVVIFAPNATRFPVENVIRDYAAKSSTETSLYYNYFKLGKREFCGIDLTPYEGKIIPNGKLPYPMMTPSTKGVKDASVAPEELFVQGFGKAEWDHIRNESLCAFAVVAYYLRQRGIILVDTKTEHGRLINGLIRAIDELYTLDSSRFWKLKPDGTILCENDEPVSFSKEFARGLANGSNPFTEEELIMIAEKYMESIELITGQPFQPINQSWESRVVADIKKGFHNV
ncbi:MAG: phosphoribosylaminoimidazolesuccinocarboxamide synthase [Patescibacteria group bacterium]|nr:phosphoribosylaminoimidazolesuccinocarboxamide synthase [Patescibacteria group bacterium]